MQFPKAIPVAGEIVLVPRWLDLRPQKGDLEGLEESMVLGRSKMLQIIGFSLTRIKKNRK